MSAQEKAVVLMLKGAISELPDEDRAKVIAAAETIRTVVDEAGEHGTLALALCGAEVAAEG